MLQFFRVSIKLPDVRVPRFTLVSPNTHQSHVNKHLILGGQNMNWIVIASFVAGVDRLYWAIFKRRDMVVPPKGGGPVGAWVQAVVSAVGGAVGALAITRLTGQSDPFTTVVGAVIAGRIVGGIVETVTPRQ